MSNAEACAGSSPALRTWFGHLRLLSYGFCGARKTLPQA